MGTFQRPAIAARNYARNPTLTIRLLTSLPPNLAIINPPMTPNELVGIFNGIDGTVRLFVTSGDGGALLPIMSS
jgi:hypothetical protein